MKYIVTWCYKCMTDFRVYSDKAEAETFYKSIFKKVGPDAKIYQCSDITEATKAS